MLGHIIAGWSPSAAETTAKLEAHVKEARQNAEKTLAARSIPVHYGNKGWVWLLRIWNHVSFCALAVPPREPLRTADPHTPLVVAFAASSGTATPSPSSSDPGPADIR